MVRADKRQSELLALDADAGTPRETVVYAGFWRRFGAFLIDALVMFAVANIIPWVLWILFFLIGFGEVPVIREVPTAKMTLLVVGHSVILPGVRLPITPVGWVIGWLYFALLESSAHQATIGKMALSIRVTDSAGARITFWRATARYWAKFICLFTGMIGFIMAGFTERKQALHDMIARCLVVRRFA